MRHHFGSRCSNRIGRYVLPEASTNRHNASFLLCALSGFNKNGLLPCVRVSQDGAGGGEGGDIYVCEYMCSVICFVNFTCLMF